MKRRFYLVCVKARDYEFDSVRVQLGSFREVQWVSKIKYSWVFLAVVVIFAFII